MSKGLKPCPSCGLEHPSLFEGVSHLVYYLCYGCGFAGGGCADESSAADAWNRRTVTLEQVEAAMSADDAWWDYNDARMSRRDLVRHLFRAAGFEVEGLRHATISKLKTEE